jgi:membrane protease YdiL (CAAX protease family)
MLASENAKEVRTMEETRGPVLTPTLGNGRVALGAVWAVFVVASLLLMDVLDGALYGVVVLTSGGAMVVASATIPRFRASFAWLRRRGDGRDLAAVALLYVAVVGLFRLAFSVFTTDNMLWFFLTFAAGLVLGVGGPVGYQVGSRRGSLADLGIGAHRWRSTLALGPLFAGVQFFITLWGYDLPRPVDWIPLLTMALTVGLFEAVFFRGFIQGRLEASFGAVPAVLGAAGLYGLYHVGYGMGGGEMFFLFALGIVYAVAYRLTENVLVLWPLLTPLGSLFAQLEAGDIRGELPWASMAGFGDVLALMVLILWLAHRRERKRRGQREATTAQTQPKPTGGSELPIAPEASKASIDLYWLPLGAGGWFVRLNGRIYEAIEGLLERRRPLDLYHSALEVRVPEGRFVIENSWPIPDGDGASRGVVVEGPVGSRRIARFRALRYEVRRWRDGVIADADEAVASPQRLSDDPRRARRLLDLVGSVPSMVWGRDEIGTGEMWNSNSVISWLLARSGLPTEEISPPAGGRAPGWEAGLVTARRQQQSDERAPRTSIIGRAGRAEPRTISLGGASAGRPDSRWAQPFRTLIPDNVDETGG